MEEIDENEYESQFAEIAQEDKLVMNVKIVGKEDVGSFSQAFMSRDFALLDEVIKLLFNSRPREAESVVHSLFEERNGKRSMISLASLALVLFWKFLFVNVSDENEKAVEQVIAELESHATSTLASFDVHKEKSFFGSLMDLSSSADAEMEEARRKAMSAGATEGDLGRHCLSASTVLAFVPLVSAIFSMRTGSKTGLIRGAYYMRKSNMAFAEAEKRLRRLCQGKAILDAFPKEATASAYCPKDLEPIAGMILFGLGIFHLSISLIPPSFQWFVKLIGFNGDRALALEELRFAALPQSPFNIKARLAVMAMKQFFLDDEDAADAIYAELEKELPDSSSILQARAGILRLRGKIRDSLKLYRRAIELSLELPQLRCQQHYHSGTISFLLNEWEAAEADLAYFLTHTSGKQFKPYAAFMLLFARYQLGQRGEPLRALCQDALSWVRANQSFDAYAKRRIESFLDKGTFDPVHVILFSATALLEGKEHKRALKLLDTATSMLAERKEERDLFGLFYYLKGANLRGIRKYERARAFLLRAVEEEPFLVDERHAVPYALVELAEMSAIDEGNYEEGLKFWNRAKSMSNYDWEKILNTRISANMDKVKRKKK